MIRCSICGEPVGERYTVITLMGEDGKPVLTVWAHAYPIKCTVDLYTKMLEAAKNVEKDIRANPEKYRPQ